ncbi:MAG: peptidylprolyl isomerase [Reichenbachiella sp.]|uniref:peptidylprolyl isomerase n=1 Tax=Reichenbachiella sp. TaxID=2184521 RepID=UPI00326599A4
MKTLPILLLLACGLIQCKEKTITCAIETEMGMITIELYPEAAPKTVANFLQYVDKGLYEQSSFFRACTPENEADREVRIEVIQGGDMAEEKELAPIEIETTAITGLLHKNGTVSMARSEPNTATCSFFICVGDQPALDFEGSRNPDGYGFAAFGQVIEGMDVVLRIQQVKEIDQYFIDPVQIIDIKRIDD